MKVTNECRPVLIAGAMLAATMAAGPAQAADNAIGQLSVLGDATVGEASDAVGISYNVMVYFSGDPVVLNDNSSAVLRLSDGVGSVSVLGNGLFSVSGDGDRIKAEVQASEVEFSFAKDKQFIVATDCFTVTSTDSLAPATGSIGANGNLVVTNGEVTVRSQAGNSQVAMTGESISCDRIAGATVAAAANGSVTGDQLWQATVAATTGVAAVAIGRSSDSDQDAPEDELVAAEDTETPFGRVAASSGISMMTALTRGGGSGNGGGSAGSPSRAESGGAAATEAAPVQVAGTPTTRTRLHASGGRHGKRHGKRGKRGRHGGIPPDPVGSPASPTKGK